MIGFHPMRATSAMSARGTRAIVAYAMHMMEAVMGTKACATEVECADTTASPGCVTNT